MKKIDKLPMGMNTEMEITINSLIFNQEQLERRVEELELPFGRVKTREEKERDMEVKPLPQKWCTCEEPQQVWTTTGKYMKEGSLICEKRCNYCYKLLNPPDDLRVHPSACECGICNPSNDEVFLYFGKNDSMWRELSDGTIQKFTNNNWVNYSPKPLQDTGVRERKKETMWAVLGKSNGIFALAHSKWKAREIRDNCFNIGDREPKMVKVQILALFTK